MEGMVSVQNTIQNLLWFEPVAVRVFRVRFFQASVADHFSSHQVRCVSCKRNAGRNPLLFFCLRSERRSTRSALAAAALLFSPDFPNRAPNLCRQLPYLRRRVLLSLAQLDPPLYRHLLTSLLLDPMSVTHSAVSDCKSLRHLRISCIESSRFPPPLRLAILSSASPPPPPPTLIYQLACLPPRAAPLAASRPRYVAHRRRPPIVGASPCGRSTPPFPVNLASGRHLGLLSAVRRMPLTRNMGRDSNPTAATTALSDRLDWIDTTLSDLQVAVRVIHTLLVAPPPITGCLAGPAASNPDAFSAGDHPLPELSSGALRRVELSVFDWIDPLGWLARTEHYFNIQGTPADQMVPLSTIYMEGSALRWLR
ncbi:hypothetical protein KSP39_PZI010435 [Platanthera zijinensis]|uniref:Uncharacterized protein n=1 Tax=Platanthera zijinensis TaxID=2320716 RepID=A0AAP0G688_9ASPA